jgi:hypothetical protein
MQSAVYAAILSFCLTSAAAAATVTVTQGEVLVSRGDGYEAIRTNAEVLAGDSLVARPGGVAKVTFGNGCSVFLAMGMVYSVPAEPPCGVQNASTTVSSPQSPGNWAAGTNTFPGDDAISPIQTASTSTTSTPGTQAIAAGDGAGGVPVAGAGAETAGTNFTPYLLGAAAIGGAVVAATSLSGGGGTPTSP